MLCKHCNQEKDTTEFYTSKTSKTGYHGNCKDCFKAINKQKQESKKLKAYKIPNGQGGKWEFDFKQLTLNTPDANYIYGLIAVLGKTNPNLRKFKNQNLFICSSKKAVVKQIADFLKMDKNAVYELPRAEEKKEASKWGLMLYHPAIVEQHNKLSVLRREEYKRGKLEAEKVL